MRPIEILKQNQGISFTSEDGDVEPLTLLPPLSPAEFTQLEKSLPCALPDEARELFAYARGFSGGALETVDFSGLANADLFSAEALAHPFALPIAADGFGNFWVVDLNKHSTTWGPIWFFCHDAPVNVFQTDSLAHFISEMIRSGNKPWTSEIDDVHDKFASQIWEKDPWGMTLQQCLDSSDEGLAEFARQLNDSYTFYDLRSPKTGMGYPWGRSKAGLVRSGNGDLYALQKEKGLLSMLFDKKK